MTARTALITGGGSGIGRAVALALAAKGYQLVLAGRRIEPLNAVAQEARDVGGEALAQPADVTDPQSVEVLFGACTERFGRLDLLFNNAGQGAPPTPTEDLAIEQWRRVVDVNLTGAFLCLQAAFRVMKAQTPQGGRIINNGSISAYSPRSDAIAYTASKHAITGLTRSASLDGRKYAIACGQIDIGNAATDMAVGMLAGVQQANGEIRPEPLMDAANVAAGVVYMDSLPLEANVQFMTVMATTMPFIGRG